MWRFSIAILPDDSDDPLVIASGLIFEDSVTVLRWTDGSNAFSFYPTDTVLDTVKANDGAAIIFDWPDGNPRDDLAHARTHAAGPEHTHHE